jgi:hypothetical protein
MNKKKSDEFKEDEWLREYCRGAHWNKFESIKNFLFFWSLFEKKVCDNNANVNRICNEIDILVKKKALNPKEFNRIYKYFKKRYTKEGKVNKLFSDLAFRESDKKGFVKAVLENESPLINDELKAVLIVVYRLRNNLFHGTKEVELLKSQIQNFKVTNELLAKIIDYKAKAKSE